MAERRLARVLLALLACVLLGGPCRAGALHLCEPAVQPSAGQQDKVLRFGAIIRSELEQSGQRLALIARSGVDLSRFGFRYSHAGLSLKASQNTPWSVRQLYYACDEQRPRIFDQGLSGFLLGSDAPSIGYVSVVFVPAGPAAALELAALDDARALQLLGADYSANAYPFSVRYQNCNQWIIELLAASWGQLGAAGSLRPQAQGWLQDRGYAPSVFEVGYRPLMWLGAFVPLVHADDHPAADLEDNRFRVSMPASIEAFVRATVPAATRIEFCRTDRHVVIRRGWDAIAEGCQPGAGDTLIALDD